jgi:glutamine amidotransferase
MIAVIDYGIGNLRSAVKALEAAGAHAELVDDPSDLLAADGVVLPGVGSFGRCAAALDRAPWGEAIREVIAAETPFLGICVGFQLLFEASEESPGVRGLGILPGQISLLGPDVKHPQIQWNQVRRSTESRLFPDPAEEVWMYFVHSFALASSPSVVATCDYGGPVVAAVEAGNVFGVQFHPEKSGDDGLALLQRFGRLCGGLT